MIRKIYYVTTLNGLLDILENTDFPDEVRHYTSLVNEVAVLFTDMFEDARESYPVLFDRIDNMVKESSNDRQDSNQKAG